MIKKLLPLVLILAGAGAGVGAGIALRPDPDPANLPEDGAMADTGDPCGIDPNAASDDLGAGPELAPAEAAALSEFVKFPEQFVIPVVEDDKVTALVVMRLTIEVAPEMKDIVTARIPKLRDGFLRIMLDHANIGGFDGQFTSNGSMETLRRGFVDFAAASFPAGIHDVLILDINRQDY
ncbi:hypothetical protein [Palleronia pelagia]|uniref:Flagellar protein FliL n=1 Tax=Palleronia pelagia TaxID=387096 RepID=A0A1H8L5V4_9RHOB|nr:hypothetical protein [Palleronia pelagia]SEO00206.1 hypothetical protein SAMN04488011_10986 [Palleronia pelagia]